MTEVEFPVIAERLAEDQVKSWMEHYNKAMLIELHDFGSDRS